jgi:hypothetical protein
VKEYGDQAILKQKSSCGQIVVIDLEQAEATKKKQENTSQRPNLAGTENYNRRNH